MTLINLYKIHSTLTLINVIQEDEYAIYNLNQQCLKYIVEVALPGDEVREISADSNISDIEEEELLENPNKNPAYIEAMKNHANNREFNNDP